MMVQWKQFLNCKIPKTYFRADGNCKSIHNSSYNNNNNSYRYNTKNNNNNNHAAITAASWQQLYLERSFTLAKDALAALSVARFLQLVLDAFLCTFPSTNSHTCKHTPRQTERKTEMHRNGLSDT